MQQALPTISEVGAGWNRYTDPADLNSELLSAAAVTQETPDPLDYVEITTSEGRRFRIFAEGLLQVDGKILEI